jgi:hypothetical protein
LILIQTLQPAEIDQAMAAAVTPTARLALAQRLSTRLGPKTVRELCLTTSISATYGWHPPAVPGRWTT